MRTLLRYPGSKQRISPWIIENMHEHHGYLEPYFGGGAVLLNKEPSRIETVNDLDDDVINLFRMIREKKEELIEAVVFTPYARQEYNASFDGGVLMLKGRKTFWSGPEWGMVSGCVRNADGRKMFTDGKLRMRSGTGMTFRTLLQT